jgi:autotransporter-associated beta strand protein
MSISQNHAASSSKFTAATNFNIFFALMLGALLASSARAGNIEWQGGTADYTNAADWVGGVVPGPADSPINSNGTNNIVEINPGDPDWFVGDISAGGDVNASGAITQNGQTLNLSGWLHIGSGTNSVGVFTLNGGTVNVTNNGVQLFMGENAGSTSYLNINGGTINMAANVMRVADGGWNGNGARTATVTQSNGVVNTAGQILIGQVALGTGIYNLAGGTINSTNELAIGHSGGNGTMNMTGGVINEVNNDTQPFAVADAATGVLNQSGGAINTVGAEFWIANSSNSVGTANLSGTGVINAGNWFAVGRGGPGVFNMHGGVLNKTGSGNITIGANINGAGSGTVNQYSGTVTNTTSQTWIGETGSGQWNMEGGAAYLGLVDICQSGTATGLLNLDGGLMQVTSVTTGNVVGFSSFYLNGGTLQAGGNSGTFISGIALAFVSPGGAVIDTQGYTVTVPEALQDGGGGLTKLGGGTLFLTGLNGYSGDTLVSQGLLVTGTSSGASGNYTAANGAGFGVQVQSGSPQFTANNVTLGSSTGATLSFDLGGFGNPASAPLNVGGTFAYNGAITVNIADALPQPGQFPLVKYNTAAANGTFVIGSLPVGVTAVIVNDTASNSIDLNITGVNLPRWDGEAGGTWDIGGTTNWVNIGTGQGTFYLEGNAVLFNDSALGTTNVNITTTVHPGSVTVTNNALNYVWSGAGGVAGGTGLLKQGSGGLSILNAANSYTGPTVIAGGSVTVSNLANGGSPSAIGASSASSSNLVLANATLSYVGPAVSINRGYLMTNNSVLNVQGNLTLTGVAQATAGTLLKTGAGTMTYAGTGTNVLSPANVGGAYQVQNGTTIFDGSAGVQTNTVVGEMWVSSTTNFAANVIFNNTGFGSSSWFALGRGNGNSGFQSSAMLTNTAMTVSYANTGSGGAGNGGGVSLGYGNGLPNLASQTLSLNGNSSLLNLGGNFNLAETLGSTAVVNVNNTSSITSIYGRNYIGDANGRGTLNFNSTATSVMSTTFGQFFLGGTGASGDAGSGAINQTAGTLKFGNGSGVYIFLSDNAGTANTSYGSYNMSGGTLSLTSGDGIRVGYGGLGSWVQSGGTLLCGRYLSIGGNGSPAGNGVATFTGGIAGIFNTAYRVLLPDAANATGVMNMGTEAGGTGFFTNLYNSGGTSFIMENSSGGNGTLNLNRGTLQLGGSIHRANTTGGSATVNLNGGTLQAGANNITLIDASPSSINMYKGGLVLDTMADIVTVSGNLTATGGNGIYPAGGLLNLSSNGGAGYIGAPLVNVTGGSGSGAMAIATVAGGLVTNVVLTCPGHGYLAGDAVTFAFLGGGFTSAASNFVYTLQAADVSANSPGGLNKVGSGVLYLNGANTYTGSTLASAGTLAGTGTIAGPVTVGSGATLGAGSGSIGTLSINNSLTFSSGSQSMMKLTPASNDQISGLTSVAYAGSLVVTNTSGTSLTSGTVYKLFNCATAGTGNFTSVTILPAGSGTFNPATGVLTIGGSVHAPALNAPVLSGGNLILSGTNGTPSSGYTVLTTTNLTPPIVWTTNSTGTLDATGSFTNSISISTNTPARFFEVHTP